MQLADHQVTNEKVKSWKGLHLLHFQGSSCSQKVRTFLAAKGIEYTSHPVNIVRHENATPWFIGINPRGVVPVLVHDGVVHVESNEIMAYADTLPSNAGSFFGVDDAERSYIAASMSREDALHADLRNLTMEFMLPNAAVRKSDRTLEAYEDSGPEDDARREQVAWWRAFAANGGVTESAIIDSIRAYHDAFDDLDRSLAGREWLIGDRMTALEVAWFISLHRLSVAGYPLAAHPHLSTLYRRLLANDVFRREVDPGAPARFVVAAYGWYRRIRGTALHQHHAKVIGSSAYA